MTHNTETDFTVGRGTSFAQAIFAPLRAADRVFQSIIASNRLAKEIENLSHSSDRKLSNMGLTRADVAQYVARTSENFRAI